MRKSSTGPWTSQQQGGDRGPPYTSRHSGAARRKISSTRIRSPELLVRVGMRVVHISFYCRAPARMVGILSPPHMATTRCEGSAMRSAQRHNRCRLAGGCIPAALDHASLQRALSSLTWLTLEIIVGMHRGAVEQSIVIFGTTAL